MQTFIFLCHSKVNLLLSLYCVHHQRETWTLVGIKYGFCSRWLRSVTDMWL